MDHHTSDFTAFPLELEAIYASAPIGMCVLDRNLRYVRINQRLAEINGVPAEAHIGRTVREIIPALADAVEPAFQRILEIGVPVLNIELSGETPAQPGVERTWLESWLPLKDEAGMVVGINIVAEEITERKRLENELRESERRFRSMADTAPAMLWITDAQGQCTYLSRGWYEYTGQTEATGLGLGWTEAAHPDDQAEARRIFLEANQKQEPFQIIYRLCNKNSEYRWAVDAGRPRFSDKGEFLGFIGSVIDIHQTREAEEMKLQSEQRLLLALQTVRMVAWEWDPEQDHISTSGNFEQIYGMPAIEVSQQGFNLLHPDDRERHQTTVQAAAALGEGYHSTFRIIRPDNGEVVWLEERSQMLRDAQGKPTKMVGVVQDITERKKAEERLELLQKITAGFAKAGTPRDVADVVMNEAVRSLGGHVGSVVQLLDDGETLELLSDINVSEATRAQFQRTSLQQNLPLTDAVRTGNPVFLESIAAIAAQYPALIDLIGTTSRSQAMACLPLRIGERTIGGMAVSFAQARTIDAEDRIFFQVLAELCAQALERANLAEQAKANATQEERHRLARELHDAVSQTLTAAAVLAETAPRVWERDPQNSFNIIRQVLQLTRSAQAELRTLLWEMRPDAIVYTKPSLLLQQLAQAINGRRGLITKVICEGEDQTYSEAVQVTLYRIAQESLNNVVKHSEAQRVTVRLVQQLGAWSLHISDNGQGFDTAQTSGGLGMSTMRERADAIGAELQITSQVGQGTQVAVIWRDNTQGLSPGG